MSSEFLYKFFFWIMLRKSGVVSVYDNNAGSIELDPLVSCFGSPFILAHIAIMY